MTVTIEQTEDLDACLSVRRAVFMDEQGVTEADEIDGLDDAALHLLAEDDGTPVGTARIEVDGEIAKIGRVCVLSSHRRAGLGASLIQAAVSRARVQPGVRFAKLGAQVQALGFYEKLGFLVQGPIYDDAGIEHRDMVLPL